MFHEESIIGGILHYRGSPTDSWAPFTPEQLTARILELRIRLDQKESPMWQVLPAPAYAPNGPGERHIMPPQVPGAMPVWIGPPADLPTLLPQFTCGPAVAPAPSGISG